MFLKGKETWRGLCKLINKNKNMDCIFFFETIINFFPSKFLFVKKDGMFAACKEKPKIHNMPSQNVISLPSIGRFVGEIAL